MLLHFVSYTCPVTRGGVTNERAYRLYGEQVRFVEVLISQAHPGEPHGAYRSSEEKLEDGRAYKREERPVAGTDRRHGWQHAGEYGGLAAAVYLIDSAGIVAFCETWGQAPALREASTISSPAAAPAPQPEGHRPPTAFGCRDCCRPTAPCVADVEP